MPSLVPEEKAREIAEEVRKIHDQAREEAVKQVEQLTGRTINDSLKLFYRTIGNVGIYNSNYRSYFSKT